MSQAPPPPRRGFGAAWWAAMLLCLVLILAGAAVGLLGPKLVPVRHPPPTAGLATRPGPAK